MASRPEDCPAPSLLLSFVLNNLTKTTNVVRLHPGPRVIELHFATIAYHNENGGVHHSKITALMSALGLVSRVSPVQTALRNCTRDEGRSFEVGNQVLISSHRKLLLSKAMVVNVAEKSGQDSDRQG